MSSFYKRFVENDVFVFTSPDSFWSNKYDRVAQVAADGVGVTVAKQQPVDRQYLGKMGVPVCAQQLNRLTIN